MTSVVLQLLFSKEKTLTRRWVGLAVHQHVMAKRRF
jgi:hypothetical protein